MGRELYFTEPFKTNTMQDEGHEKTGLSLNEIRTNSKSFKHLKSFFHPAWLKGLNPGHHIAAGRYKFQIICLTKNVRVDTYCRLSSRPFDFITCKSARSGNMQAFVWAHCQRFKTRETSCPDLSTSCDTSSKTWVNYWARHRGWQTWPLWRVDGWHRHLNDWITNRSRRFESPRLKSFWICGAESGFRTRHNLARSSILNSKACFLHDRSDMNAFHIAKWGGAFTCTWATLEMSSKDLYKFDGSCAAVLCVE